MTQKHAFIESLWLSLPAIEDSATFYTTWLSQLAASIANVENAVLMLKHADDSTFTPVALWPDPDQDISHLSAAAEAAITQRSALIYRAPETREKAHDTVQVCCPIALDGVILGIVIIDLLPRADKAVHAILTQVQWALGWLQSHLWQQRVAQNTCFNQRTAMALDILSVAQAHTLIEPACMAVANEIAIQCHCDKVSIGLIHQRQKTGARIRLQAMSHSAWFRKKTALVDDLENAMEEALDQSASVVYPPQPYANQRISVAHKAYVESWAVAHMISVVLIDQSNPIGVLTLERRNPQAFDAETYKRVDHVAPLLAPILDLKRRERRWISGRFADAVRHSMGKLFGPRHPALKLLTSVLLLGMIFLLYYPATFKISGDAVLEGVMQRASVAPFDGFIASSEVRAGDVTTQNQLLATLDDKDFKIEVLKWESERSKLVQQQREALATKKRTEIALLAAQIKQAEAQLSLAQLKLARTRLYAPINGLVISGDLSQKLGAPVQKGDILFEIAPLKDYRVVLNIDERDIRYLTVGDHGTLLLSGLAGNSLPLTIVNVTAVARAHEGVNGFRVEATLDASEANIRPGMEGVGKIHIDQRSLGWIWTRRFADWVRMLIWRWS